MPGQGEVLPPIEGNNQEIYVGIFYSCARYGGGLGIHDSDS